MSYTPYSTGWYHIHPHQLKPLSALADSQNEQATLSYDQTGVPKRRRYYLTDANYHVVIGMDDSGGSRGVMVKNREEKERGRCECCGKEPRILEAIDDGHKLCRKCYREIRPSRNEDATEKQIAYLKALGFVIPPQCTKGTASDLIDNNKDISYYLMDAWETMTGKRPKFHGITFDEIRILASQIMQYHKALATSIMNAQEYREDRMYELQEEAQERAAIYSNYESDINILDFKQGITTDGTYDHTVKLLGEVFKNSVPLHIRLGRMIFGK